MKRRLGQVALTALCMALWAVPSAGQVYTGRIDVTVTDSTGALLPGVTVEATGPQTSVAVTDARGEAHFLNLAPGRYTLTAKLSGFSDYRNESVPVSAGSIVPLAVSLGIAGVATQVEVRAETPVIETKRQTVQTNVTVDELQNIPTSRDPWVVLQTVPGIITDRVNVGGSESGQQSDYQAKGAAATQNTWNMDGVPITDMSALGASPTYYDFDMFQEMQVTTGGADITNPTPGVQLNFVLRSGTNQWRGSGRVYFEDGDIQSDNVSEDVFGEILSYNRIREYKDYGLEGGGPIIRNRLFAWGAYGKTEPELRIFRFNTAANDYLQTAQDRTVLENYSAKVTAEISQKTRGLFAYFRGNKEKFGRGAAADRPDETTYNQTGPTDLFKFEVNQTVGNNLFLVGRYAKTLSNFSLTPRGGLDVNSYRDDARIYHASFGFYATDRPQDNIAVEGNMFKGRHELKFGFGWRKATVTSESGWPGTGVLTLHRGYPNMTARVVRNWALAGEGQYTSLYFGDTISLNRLTLNLGARWDRGTSSISEANVPGSPADPVLLPALSAPAVKNAIDASLVTPRVGFTYALNDTRKTILRGSYAMFGSQLNAVQASIVASQIPYYSYVYYSAVDTNGNQVADPGEFGTFLGVAGFDPDDPLGGNPDRIGDYGKPRTHEVLFGIEHEVFQDFGVSANVTWRRFTNFNWLHPRGTDSRSYILAGHITGNVSPIGAFDVPYYIIDPDLAPEDLGEIYEERPGYHQRYLGFELSATKRMSNNWMMRLGWSSNVHREYFDGPEAVDDPTRTLTEPNEDGGLVMTETAGSGKTNLFLVLPKYQFIAAGAYRAKWGINLGMNYLMRQGYSAPYYREETEAADLFNPENKEVLLLNSIDDFRLPTVHSVDARIGKTFTYQRMNINFDVDIFNLFNASPVLRRQYDESSTEFDDVIEIMNPRIVRFGVRIGF